MSRLRLGIAVALLSGVALSFAFPEPDIAPLAWIALVPLLLLLDEVSPSQGLALGLAFGFGFFGSLLIWVSLVGWVAWALLVIIQALFIGAFGAAWAVLGRRAGWVARVIVPAALWVVLEYARSVFPTVGFTWGELAQSQHNLRFMLRAAAFGGGWGVALIVVLVNTCVAEAVRRLRARNLGLGAVAGGGAAALLCLPLLLPVPDATGSMLRIGVVQGNVPDLPPSQAKEFEILDSHRELTESLAAHDLALVVWPESSVGIDPEVNDEAAAALADAARAAGAPLIVGANLDAGEDRYLVVALHVGPDGSIVDRYQKTHLVPFGEYVPWRKYLDWIPLLDQVPTDAVAGHEPRIFDLAGGKVAPVISFEGDFGSLVRRRIDVGGRLLVVATNTSTWGRSWASAQHVAFSQVRAAENGVWVAHAAISGISALIAPDGEVVDRSELWTADTLVRAVAFAEDTTFYTRVGDWVPLLCALGIAGYGLMLLIGRRRASGAASAGPQSKSNVA